MMWAGFSHEILLPQLATLGTRGLFIEKQLFILIDTSNPVRKGRGFFHPLSSDIAFIYIRPSGRVRRRSSRTPSNTSGLDFSPLTGKPSDTSEKNTESNTGQCRSVCFSVSGQYNILLLDLNVVGGQAVSMMTETDLSSPTSTSSSFGDLSPKKMEDKANYRKSNKPMMEKKRRARINSCLTQLKTLVLEAMKKDNSQYSKLEKADILELTVKHLKNVQRYQGNNTVPMPEALSKYRAGFNECANEVMRYLGESQGVNEEARSRILSHLASILTPLNNLPLQQGHSHILPAPAPPAQSHQQRHFQLQHLQLHQQNVYLTAPMKQSAQVVTSIDTNNNQPLMSQPVYRPHSGNAHDLKNIISGSPTAFQTPISTAISPAATTTTSLQLPCIAATAMGTAQFQLVPSSAGQVALVLTPQAIPAINLYTSHQLSRPPQQQQQHQHLTNDNVKHGHDNPSAQMTRLDDYKSNSTQAPMVMKAPLSSRGDSKISGPYKRSPSPYEIQQPSSIPSSPSTSPFDLRQSYPCEPVVLTTSPPMAPMSRATTNNNTVDNSLNNKSSNIIRATSTWRPW
ncbi:hypothetical protein Btru_033054 [Bulinus truncatus]|nr:hypothetical protein Btru_033054 [Bulinus truncatus]